tara:strand:- start:1772 stop:2245 length:474 start_codon:yes stop_codon:yes gene_type:complete
MERVAISPMEGHTMMKTVKAAFAALALLATPALAEEADKLVTVVTSPDAQTQLMSMVLTMQAVQMGRDVQILLCGPGGDIALKAAPESATAGQPPKGMSPQGLLQAAIKNGAKANVCAIYLPGKGATPDVLIDGVGVAAPPAMAGAMLGEDTVVWSF